ncbi:hypothetical protein FEM48_Zijuj10G0035800 [Ziziphus jujuba var. spinosa]|uniref:Uncharacterized protein n=1 Tax=Ziziphus jujuba var. spinosa TaxID=714518 RepID=A0A978UL20_ZIZJJ|nr:uncharacterized protein LOC107428362 [Ziziphus jujuba var. spinosa]KAH7515522.1 hypothetical protein FEM48_Zijuj10G0035800 [Ziziphus jujuba var. spinosa]
MSSRRRPLHTCGLSAIAVAHRAYAAAQNVNGPLGSMAKRVDKIVALATPIVHAMQYQLLALLCFADDHILLVENMIEKFFPPSKNAFDKIDELVKATETLPEKFDHAVKRFPTIIHQFPFLDWALVHIISILNFLISTLTHWGSQITKEKEIVVDINCSDQSHNSASHDKLQHSKEHLIHATDGEKSGDFPPISETQQDKTMNCVNPKPDAMKGTYKDVLEKGTKEDMDNNLENITVNQEETETEKEGSEDEEDENISKDDPILELFESGWLMNTGTRSRETLSRSGSET